jgi:hypothetical protein
MGCVYKLVEARGIPRIKVSQELGKMTIPGKKEVYRLFGKDGYSLLDLMIKAGDRPPEPETRILCHHPFDQIKRVYVTPSKIIPSSRLGWERVQPSFIEGVQRLRSEPAAEYKRGPPEGHQSYALQGVSKRGTLRSCLPSVG